MTTRVAVNESTLRRAMRDARYWTAGHPDREALAALVRDGYAALEGQGASDAVVLVRAHTRRVNGTSVTVAAHWRAGRVGGEATLAGATQAPSGDMVRFAATGEDGQPPRVPMERIPNQSGKETVTNFPSWARGSRRYVGETAEQYAYRVMDEHHGGRAGWLRGPRDLRSGSDF